MWPDFFYRLLNFVILVAVLVFEIVLNATAMFNHGNIRIPAGLDRLLRLVVVTPDMHRVHHSHLDYETNSNFGFNLSLWDRLFGTYRAQPDEGHEDMVIGIDTFGESAPAADVYKHFNITTEAVVDAVNSLI